MPRSDRIEIRPARPADCRAMGRMGAALARAHHAWDPERFFIWEEIEKGYAWWLGRELKNRRAILLVAQRRGRVIGYAYGRLEPRDWNSLRDRCGVGIDLFVEPRHRGAGAGAMLAAALVEALEAKGAPRVVIQAAAKNREAQRFFRALGFRRTVIEMTRERGRALSRRRPAKRT